MSEEKRTPCPYCKESIMLGAKKCPICKEWIEQEVKEQEVKTTSEEPKTHKTSSLMKLFVFFALIGLGITLGVYEQNAHQILSYADSIDAEGLHETSTMAYKKIVEDYPLSIATVRANQQLEKVSPEYLLPLRTAQICASLLLFLIGIKLNKGCPIRGTILIFLISGAFLIVQGVAYGKIDVPPLEELTTKLMKNPQILFFISYALIVFTGIAMLCNPEPSPERRVERRIQLGHTKGTSAGKFIGIFLLIIVLIIIAAIGLFVYITISTGGVWLLGF